MPEAMTKHFDVIVAGGGAGGLAAAVAAARMGARVLLVERYGFLGGAAANSLVLAYCGFFQKGETPVSAVEGIGAEVLRDLAELGQDVSAVRSRSGNWIIMLDPEAVKFAFDRFSTKTAVTVLLHSRVTGVATAGEGIASVTLTDHAGSHEISASAFVDATGEATVCHLAGVEMFVDATRDDNVQPASMPIRIGGVAPNAVFDRKLLTQLIAEHNAGAVDMIPRADGGIMMQLPASGDYWWMNIDLVTDGLTGASLTHVEQQARREAWRNLALLRKLPGFENAYIAATGPQIGTRESRRPRSLHDLTGEALSRGTRRPDGIGRAAWPIEVHEAPGRARFVDIGGDGFADIPLDALRVSGKHNLFLAGRVAGADEAAYGSLRVMGTAFATGHAAGVAAAHSALGKELSVTIVRRELAKQGALI